MQQLDGDGPAGMAFTGAPRPLRHLAPPDAPWPATLACDDDGDRWLLVDARLLADWQGWDVEPGGHVAGVCDVVRRADGHDVVLPACTLRLDEVLSRRAAAGGPGAGEIVTVAVSLLRGCARLCDDERAEPTAHGRWWVCDDGRPVFVLGGPGEAGLIDATHDLVRVLRGGDAAAVGRDDPLARLDEALRSPRMLRGRQHELEAALFAMARPCPLAVHAVASDRAGDGVRRTRGRARTQRGPTRETTGSTAPGGATGIPARIGRIASDAVTAVWRRTRPDRPGRTTPRRRRPVMAAGGVAVAVLAAGLLWPAGGTAAGPSPAPRPRASGVTSTPTPHPAADREAPASTVSTAAPTPAASTVPGVSGPDGPVGLAEASRALLRARRACDGAACRAALQEDPAVVLRAGAVDLPETARTLTVIDDFGGAGVIRLHPADGRTPDQLVVVIRTAGRWVLRDVHDVAQHP